MAELHLCPADEHARPRHLPGGESNDSPRAFIYDPATYPVHGFAPCIRPALSPFDDPDPGSRRHHAGPCRASAICRGHVPTTARAADVQGSPSLQRPVPRCSPAPTHGVALLIPPCALWSHDLLPRIPRTRSCHGAADGARQSSYLLSSSCPSSPSSPFSPPSSRL